MPTITTLSCLLCGNQVQHQHVRGTQPPKHCPICKSDLVTTGTSAPAKPSRWVTVLSLFAMLVVLVCAAGYVVLEPSTRYAYLANEHRDQTAIIAQIVKKLVAAIAAIFALSIVPALIVAGITALCRGPFRKSLSIAYTVLAPIMAGLLLCGGVLKRARHKLTAECDAVRMAVADFNQPRLEAPTDTSTTLLPNNAPVQSAQPATRQAETRKMEYSTADQLRAASEAHLNAIIQQRNLCRREVDASGLKNLLKAERVAADTGLGESRAMLANLQRIVKRHYDNSTAQLASFSQELTTLAGHEQIPAGLRQEQQSQQNLLKQYWEADQAILSAAEQALNHLHASRKGWKAENGTFLFKNDSDLNRFNQLQQQLQNAIAKAKALDEQTKAIGN